MDVKGKLYYGDNLKVLKDHIPSESVDLIYLDPPFNSKANYNILYSSPTSGEQSQSQIQAFEDTWHWGPEAQLTFDDIMKSPNTKLATLMEALRRFLGENDMMAYLVMMAVRLQEMHRVLKVTGSLYLHCDPKASHYLKLVLDAVFGHRNFRNEIIWDYSFRLMDLPRFFNRKHDVILFYAKSDNSKFFMPKTEWTKEEIISTRKQQIIIDENGVEWIWMPGGKGNSKNKLKKIADIIAEGKAISDVWAIPIISSSSKERLGYPTQKPLSLLERIIQASSEEGDTVLDPFCGCGTAVHAAQKLGRNWIGIDITHLAISHIEKRLRDAFPEVVIDTEGIPVDIDGAQELAIRNKYQFQWWAVSLVRAHPYQDKKKGSDGGIDGLIFFKDGDSGEYKKIVVSVKGGIHVNSGMIRDLVGTMEREKASIGLFITLAEPTREMLKDASARPMYESPLTNRKYPSVQILTVKGLLEGTQRAEFPDLQLGENLFKKAKVERTEKESKLF